MDKIMQAVEWAKARERATPHPHERRISGHTGIVRPASLMSSPVGANVLVRPQVWAKQVELNDAHLENQRVIGHVASDPSAKYFDMLRTPILQIMDAQNWQFLAVTSPTAACGKTLTAINLALSIARNAERTVLLVDLNLQNPQVARRLGLEGVEDSVGVLQGRLSLSDAVVQTHIGDTRLLVLPTEAALPGSSELMASRAMISMLQAIRLGFPSHIVIFDLPPVLAGDDVIAFLPHVDCAVLVAAVGVSSIQEIDECRRHLQETKVVRMVVNKVPMKSRL